MRKITILVDNFSFRAEIRRSGNGRVPPMTPAELAKVPVGVTILIGDRSPEFGGGLSGTGYVMLHGKAIGTASVSSAEVTAGFVAI